MVLLLELALLLALLSASSLGPGLVIVRRFRWGPLETLAASIALSHFLVFVAAMLMFVCGVPISFGYAVTAACVAATWHCRRDVAGLLRDGRSRRAVVVWTGLFLWLVLVDCNLRHYSGGGWYGDWLGHYDRVRFFAHRGEAELPYHQVVGGLAARPPLMNVLVAHFIGQVELRFELFQLAFVYLSSLAYLAVALFASPRPSKAIVVVGVLLGLTPFFVQNAVYTWTKLYTAFFVVAGVAFYAQGLRRGDTVRLVAAFLLLAVGSITHYSAGPYLVLLAGHYLLCEWRRRPKKFRELAAIASLGALVLATWFPWSIATYGLHETFAANTSVEGFARETPSRRLALVLDNFSGTLVPYPLREIDVDSMGAESVAVRVRDASFLFLQQNFFGLFGLSGSVAAVWLLVRGGKAFIAQHWRWGLFLVCSFALGVGVHGGSAHGTGRSWGVASICLQPIALIGLAWIANGWELLPLVARRVIIVLKALEVGAGIVLHTYFQAMPVRGLEQGYGGRGNWRLKLQGGVAFLGDTLGHFPLLLVPIVLLPLLVLGLAFMRSRGGGSVG